MRVGIATSGFALIALGVGAWLSTTPGTAADRDCSDFDSQRDAQEFYEAHGPGDPHNLDGDGDGVACETSPCPCAKTGSGGGSGTPGKARRTKARVASIVDGDTIEVRTRGRRRPLRIIGIDTPERGECGYDQATNALARRLRRGERVKLISDPSQPGRDRYGRLLRYVHDGRIDVGRKQLLRGWARVLVVGTGFRRVQSYRKAERKARRGDRGAWSRC